MLGTNGFKRCNFHPTIIEILQCTWEDKKDQWITRIEGRAFFYYVAWYAWLISACLELTKGLYWLSLIFHWCLMIFFDFLWFLMIFFDCSSIFNNCCLIFPWFLMIFIDFYWFGGVSKNSRGHDFRGHELWEFFV